MYMKNKQVSKGAKADTLAPFFKPEQQVTDDVMVLAGQDKRTVSKCLYEMQIKWKRGIQI